MMGRHVVRPHAGVVAGLSLTSPFPSNWIMVNSVFASGVGAPVAAGGVDAEDAGGGEEIEDG